jgi:sugar phosphate isomerase/epimerase
VLYRREFLKTTFAAAVGGVFAAFPNGSNGSRLAKTHLERIGLGLFTIPKLLDQDFAGTMKMLAQIGYKEIEFFGPYPFSVPAAHERWKAISAALGVRRSGYFELTAQQMKKVLDQSGLSSPSMHIDLNTLRTRMNEIAEAAHALGQRYVCLPSIPAEERKNLDAYKRVADEFNEIGARAAKAGLRFAYHNHGYGLAEMEGQIPFKVLLERTDPKLVDLQMDIYWTTAGGADPIALLKTYPGRFRLMHIKDMTKRVRFAGDGGDAQQWMALFPFIADAGSGVLDLPAILAQAKKSGVQHFFVERDLAPNPTETLKKSYQYLAALEFE